MQSTKLRRIKTSVKTHTLLSTHNSTLKLNDSWCQRPADWYAVLGRPGKPTATWSTTLNMPPYASKKQSCSLLVRFLVTNCGASTSTPALSSNTWLSLIFLYLWKTKKRQFLFFNSSQNDEGALFKNNNNNKSPDSPGHGFIHDNSRCPVGCYGARTGC